MQPKRFSEYTPITVTDGNEIVPIVKNGQNETVLSKNLPVPLAVQTEIDTKADAADLTAHIDDTANPHQVTKTQVGLANVPNLDTTAAVANQHTHANKTILDNTTASFTTELATEIGDKIQIGGDLSGTESAPLVKSRTASKTVAMAGAGIAADYLCDGTADQTEINAALTAVSTAGGGEVLVRFSRAYVVSAPITIPSNVSLKFEHNSLVTLAASSNCSVITNSDSTNGNVNISLSGVEINANRPSQVGNFHCIHFTKVNDSQISFVELHDATYNGVLLTTCLRVAISKSEVYDCTHELIALNGSSYCTVKDNHVHDGTTAGILINNNSTYNNITYNRSLNNDLYGILNGDGNTTANENNYLSGNIVEYNGDDALVMDGAPHSRVIANQVRYNGSHAGDQGLPVDKSPFSVLEGNIVEFNRADGIEFKNNSHYCTVSGNVTRNNSNSIVGGINDGSGIVVRDGIVGCSITGNTSICDEVTPSQRRGIMLTGTGVDYNTVKGNTVYGNSVNQIELSSNIGTHNVIWGNSGANGSAAYPNTNDLIGRMDNQLVRFTTSSTANTMEFVPTGNTGSARTKGVIYVDNSSNLGNGFTMYSTGATTGQVGPLMSLRVGDTTANTTWNFDPAIMLATNVSTKTALRIDQANALDASQGALVVRSTVAQTTANAYGMAAFVQSNASTTNRVVWIDNSGLGENIQVRSTGGGKIAILTQASNNMVIDSTKTVTNQNSSTVGISLSNSHVVNDAGSYTKTGTLVNITSSITQTSGTITDTAKMVVITQSNPSATGNIVEVANAGTGSSLVIDTTSLVVKNGRTGHGTASPTSIVDVGASTTSAASLRIRPGTAPTSPNDGDIWHDGTHIQARIAGATYQIDQQALAAASTGSNWQASDSGLLAWAYDPTPAVNSSLIPSAGVMQCVKIPVAAGTITNIIMDLVTVGSGLTSGQCFAAIYQGGNLLGQTADQAANWASGTNTKTMALASPVTVVAGYVYVTFWANGTTLPAFARAIARSNINGALSNTAYRYGSAGSSLTTTAPSTLGTMSASSISWWVGLS